MVTANCTEPLQRVVIVAIRVEATAALGWSTVAISKCCWCSFGQ
ncbi:hypothetical protein [Streptomyces incanus]|uniref:Uncharacterized protein n=1 Tax=Streptomyces incanus TaxID=887453 RepID=A0ABW0Y3U4_9ACTN